MADKESTEFFTRIKARPLDDLLRDLTSYSRRKSEVGGKAPKVSMYLKSGAVFRGWLLDQQPTSVIMRIDAGDLSTEDEEVAMLLNEQIAGVVVHQAREAASVLSSGTVEYVPGVEAPSRLKLERRLLGLRHNLADLLGAQPDIVIRWDHISDEPAVRVSLAELLDDLEAVLLNIVNTYGDQLGGQTPPVRVEPADSPGVFLIDGYLHVCWNPHAGLQGRMERSNLEHAIMAPEEG